MNLPQSQKLKSAVLGWLSDGEARTVRVLTGVLDGMFRVTAGERKDFEINVEKTLTALKQEGFVELGQGGLWKISKLGLEEWEEEEDMKPEEELAGEE